MRKHLFWVVVEEDSGVNVAGAGLLGFKDDLGTVRPGVTDEVRGIDMGFEVGQSAMAEQIFGRIQQDDSYGEEAEDG